MTVSFNLLLLAMNALAVLLSFLIPLSFWLAPRVWRSKAKKVNQGRVPAGTKARFAETIGYGVAGTFVIYTLLRTLILAPPIFSVYQTAMGRVEVICVFAICAGSFPNLCGDWLKRFVTDFLRFDWKTVLIDSITKNHHKKEKD